MLALQLERLSRITTADQLMVATSDHASDDTLAEFCRANDIACARGSLDDVLDRFYQAAVKVEADHVIRLTGDCPLADPALIDSVVETYLKSGCDYVSNTIQPTYPDGLDVEVFSFEALKIAWQEARLPSQREHVTPFIWQQPERFKVANYAGDKDLSELRWTVDEPEDLELVRMIYEELYPANPDFSTADVLDLLQRRPELNRINNSFERNEGLQKSLATEAGEVSCE
jgi:spore coat polysaccharide biosynthesis protein SpsF